jgi:uncharacterized protein involved in exopolysaccharide biosynthesis
MELMRLLRGLRRWLWLTVSVVLVTVLVLGLRLRSGAKVYKALAKLQLTIPQSEDVAAFDQYRYVSLRDEMTVARNNFIEVLRSEQVRARTIEQLALDEDDAEYGFEVASVRDSDFIHVVVEASTAEMAAQIANIHASAAIAYYGELRAKPTDAEKDLFEAQLRVSEEELRAAEAAFADFKSQNGVASLEDVLATHLVLLEQLQLERDNRALEDSIRGIDPVGDVDGLISQHQQELDRLLALAPTYNVLEESAQRAREDYQETLDTDGEDAEGSASDVLLAARISSAEQEFRSAEEAFATFKAEHGIASLETELATYQRLLEILRLERNQRLLDEPNGAESPQGSAGHVAPTAEVDALIAKREQELARLVALGPTYRLLEDNARLARGSYQHMQDKYTEAAIKAQAVRAANFIQVVEPAQAPLRPVSNLKTVVLAISGSLGLGVLLAVLMEYILAFQPQALEPGTFVLPDSWLDTLRESQRAANTIVVGDMTALEAPPPATSE